VNIPYDRPAPEAARKDRFIDECECWPCKPRLDDVAIDLERETGIEPATFSLGKWLQIENKEHSEFGHLFQAIEFTGNSQVSSTQLLMVFKWSSPDAGRSFAVHKTSP
jgi:hypothetical protein